jgi:hypothetical protein
MHQYLRRSTPGASALRLRMVVSRSVFSGHEDLLERHPLWIFKSFEHSLQ